MLNKALNTPKGLSEKTPFLAYFAQCFKKISDLKVLEICNFFCFIGSDQYLGSDWSQAVRKL